MASKQPVQVNNGRLEQQDHGVAGTIVRPATSLYKEVMGALKGRMEEGMQHVERVLPLGASLTVVGELSQVAAFGLQMKGAVTINGMAFVIGPSK